MYHIKSKTHWLVSLINFIQILLVIIFFLFGFIRCGYTCRIFCLACLRFVCMRALKLYSAPHCSMLPLLSSSYFFYDGNLCVVASTTLSVSFVNLVLFVYCIVIFVWAPAIYTSSWMMSVISKVLFKISAWFTPNMWQQHDTIGFASVSDLSLACNSIC